jgi:hypothetical protein
VIAHGAHRAGLDVLGAERALRDQTVYRVEQDWESAAVPDAHAAVLADLKGAPKLTFEVAFIPVASIIRVQGRWATWRAGQR